MNDLKKYNDCFCYFTNKIMVEPVIASDSNTYEKKILLNLMQKYKKLNMPFYSPITNDLMNESYIPDLFITQKINELEEYQENNSLIKEFILNKTLKNNTHSTENIVKQSVNDPKIVDKKCINKKKICNYFNIF